MLAVDLNSVSSTGGMAANGRPSLVVHTSSGGIIPDGSVITTNEGRLSSMLRKAKRRPSGKLALRLSGWNERFRPGLCTVRALVSFRLVPVMRNPGSWRQPELSFGWRKLTSRTAGRWRVAKQCCSIKLSCGGGEATLARARSFYC